MGERELGKALLELNALDLAGMPDVRKQTEKVLDRDRRRMRWLTAFTVLAWLAAAAMILGMLVAFGLLFPFQAKLKQEQTRKELGPAEIERLEQHGQVMFQMLTVGVTFSVGLLGAASLLTILLVVGSRRATLRQINASLVVISEQLKELQQRPASG